jgi:nucleolar pre-ribosomal-associated protein 1
MMAKRPVEPVVDDGNQAYLKRQKIKHVPTTSAEDIQSSRKLQQLLAFDQDAGRAKHGKLPSVKLTIHG